MTTLREAAQQALEALEDLLVWHSKNSRAITAITALKAALEQPEQAEPVAWIQSNHLQLAQRGPFSCRVEPTQRHPDFVPLYTHPPRREAEPAAFDALVAISLLTHLGGEVADYEDVVEAVRRLSAVNRELLEALLEERRVRLMGQEDDVHWESLRDMRRAAMAATDAAIAKAEGA
jgi:hypothetical protein